MAKRKTDLAEDLPRDTPKYPNQTLTLILSIPPSVNHMYIHRGNKKILTKIAKDFVQDAQNRCLAELKKSKWKKDNDNVWYIMDLYFYMPDKRIRDSHNCIKLLTDSLEGILFSNDFFVLPRIQYVTLDRTNPRLEILYYPQEV